VAEHSANTPITILVILVRDEIGTELGKTPRISGSTQSCASNLKHSVLHWTKRNAHAAEGRQMIAVGVCADVRSQRGQMKLVIYTRVRTRNIQAWYHCRNVPWPAPGLLDSWWVGVVIQSEHCDRACLSDAIDLMPSCRPRSTQTDWSAMIVRNNINSYDFERYFLHVYVHNLPRQSINRNNSYLDEPANE
jgi:hypothetical protein